MAEAQNEVPGETPNHSHPPPPPHPTGSRVLVVQPEEPQQNEVGQTPNQGQGQPRHDNRGILRPLIIPEILDENNNNILFINEEDRDEGYDPNDDADCDCFCFPFLNKCSTLTLGIVTWGFFICSLGLLIYNWIQYGLDLRVPVTFSHYYMHNVSEYSYSSTYFARHLMAYVEDSCHPIMIMDTSHFESKNYTYPGFGLNVPSKNPELRSTTTTQLTQCTLSPRFSFGAVFLDGFIPAFALVFEFSIALWPRDFRKDQYLRAMRTDDPFGFFTCWICLLIILSFWKLVIIFLLSWHGTSAHGILRAIMERDVLQSPDLAFPSFKWDQTQRNGRCCGLDDYKFWKYNSTFGGYPKSCCNFEKFKCKDLQVITSNQVWKGGCLEKEVDSALSQTILLLLLQFLDVFLMVGFTVFSFAYAKAAFRDANARNANGHAHPHRRRVNHANRGRRRRLRIPEPEPEIP